jgi:hypothetical protein
VTWLNLAKPLDTKLMKLYHFDLPRRAEVARIMLELGGVQYEDVRFNREQWMSQYKAKSPSGQAPFLELDNGKLLCQSFAIHMYAAAKSGFLPADPESIARIVELNACFDDVRSATLDSLSLLACANTNFSFHECHWFLIQELSKLSGPSIAMRPSTFTPVNGRKPYCSHQLDGISDHTRCTPELSHTTPVQLFVHLQHAMISQEHIDCESPTPIAITEFRLWRTGLQHLAAYIRHARQRGDDFGTQGTSRGWRGHARQGDGHREAAGEFKDQVLPR